MRLLALTAAALALASPAAATTVVDASNDLLATYTGVSDPSLDILLATATFDGASYTLSATTRGAIGLPGSLYVFGINRGAGTPRLTAGSPSIGAGINWDAVAVLFSDGTGRVATFSATGAPVITPLSAGAVSVNGASITGVVPLSLLPSTGFAPSDYQFALWSRLRVNPAVDGSNAEIADFAPNASSFAAGVPEPGTWLLMISGLGLIGGAMRGRRRYGPLRPASA